MIQLALLRLDVLGCRSEFVDALREDVDLQARECYTVFRRACWL